MQNWPLLDWSRNELSGTHHAQARYHMTFMQPRGFTMSENVPPFSLSAQCQGLTQTAKRGDPSSAMVLADRWAELGCQNIQITDAAGTVRDRDQFRANLRLVKRLRLRSFAVLAAII